MRTQRRLRKISIAISLVGLALGFSVLGILIVAKEHDGVALIASGVLGILLGAACLVAACLHWNFFDQIQVEEVPGTEIASECEKLAMKSIASDNFKDVRVPVRIMKPGLATRCRPSERL